MYLGERKSGWTRLIAALLAMAVSTFLLACKGRSETAAAEGPKGQSSSKTSADSPTLAMLNEYEAVRAQLARDSVAGVAEASERLAEQANRSASSAPQTSETLRAIGGRARSLKEASGRGLSEARLSFGELSRSVVGLLARDASLQAGRWVFECPMASGYKKWVQTTDSIDNPYMGKSMPGCGEQTSWTP